MAISQICVIALNCNGSQRIQGATRKMLLGSITSRFSNVHIHRGYKDSGCVSRICHARVRLIQLSTRFVYEGSPFWKIGEWVG
jgi:hypothetical protein